MGLVSQVEFARQIAEHSGRTVESCQVSLSQWIAAGHLAEGDGLADGMIDARQAAAQLLERLDLGQATGNGLQTTLALEIIAGIDQAADETDSDSIAKSSLHHQKLEGQARQAQANATRMELKAAQEAGDLMERPAAEAVMARLLAAEITAWRQFLDDMAVTVAGEHGLDVQALRQRFRDLFREHRTNRASVAQKVAAAMTARVDNEPITESDAAEGAAEG